MKFSIQGKSMAPYLLPHDTIHVSRLRYLLKSPNIGDIVLARHPFRRNILIVKRIVAVQKGTYMLLGDNAMESEDSASFGPLSERMIIGKVIKFQRTST